MKFDVKHTMTLMAAAMVVLFAAAIPAAADTQVFHAEDTFSVFIPCANGGLGEDVNGTMKVQAVFSETDDGAGGTHFRFKFRFRGTGIGSVTGDTYQYHADIPFIFVDRENNNAGGASNIGFSYTVDLIGTGGAVTYHLDAHFQGTMNANGVITMEKGSFTPVETCN